MNSTIKFYNPSKGFGWINNPEDPNNDVWFHISNVSGELEQLFEARKYMGEPITFDVQSSAKKPGQLEARNIRFDLQQRSVGFVTQFENGFGWIEDFHSKETYFIHYSKVRGSDARYIRVGKGDPVVFTKNENEKGNEALDVVIVDNRCSLEVFAEFDDFLNSLLALKAKCEPENWDYIKQPTSGEPVLFSYINHTFNRIMAQDKLLTGKSNRDNKEYAYFNTGLVTPTQDEIYAYFVKVPQVQNTDEWHIKMPQYEFLEFDTDQSRYRIFFPDAPEIATYFSEAQVTELIYDTSLNGGKILVDKEHIKGRKNRFPPKISSLDDEAFFDAINKSIELAIRRVKRNYKTAIPHFYEGKIQFLLPLCMLSKKEADLALVVNREESVYKAHTVLTLDQAYNNARLLAKPDREWLNP